MDLLSCDVLVVGGGAAGLRAAIAVAEVDPKLQIGLVSAGGIGSPLQSRKRWPQHLQPELR